VPVELVHQLETEHQTTLMAKAAKPELVNSVEVVSLESVNFSEVKDKAERESMVQLVATQQVVKAKSFLGFTIDSLYSFFMIFVFMAGIASLLLFFFSRKLLKMMHGIQ
jgi:POT family proton-dependent oligopeptide transporter